jgi:AraC-like DNA-binding protein
VTDALYYEARPDADLFEHVRCVWFRRVGQAEAERPIRIVPDGCMDLMWRGDRLEIAGPDTTAHVSVAPAGTTFVGLRFNPGAASPVLGVPASELVDARPEAAALWGPAATELAALLEELGPFRRSERSEESRPFLAPPSNLAPPSPLLSGSAAAAAALLQDAVRRRLAEAPAPDRLVQHVVRSLQNAPPGRAVPVERLADRAGVSPRQLHRRCSAALGYGPKTFAGILRFQRFLEGARRAGPGGLAAIALESGYADQPHLTREVRRLTGLTPAQLLGSGANRSTELPSGSWRSA